ncbi:MAG: methylenetetrahydrofolate reductase [Clostridia bacterium]|nr:methylenetetrahydrofolate reductase [Clostridia bacterium]
MKIIDIIKGERPCLSFEVFPPKTSDKYASVSHAVSEIAKLNPGYMSVTYGAGGGTSDYTAKIAAELLSYGVTPLAHLSCVSSTREKLSAQIEKLKSLGIENILALRGDIPDGMDKENLEYRYAYELIDELKMHGDFCIGGACYPEGHPESVSVGKDIEYLKTKVDSGCQFLTTQMFFDNNILYNFLYRLLRTGVDVPVVAGIMPVTNASQVKRICSISGNTLPQKFLRIVERYGDNPAAMKQAGIAYAAEQIIDLYANGINAVHVYSMNNADVAFKIRSMLSDIIA